MVRAEIEDSPNLISNPPSMNLPVAQPSDKTVQRDVAPLEVRLRRLRVQSTTLKKKTISAV